MSKRANEFFVPEDEVDLGSPETSKSKVAKTNFPGSDEIITSSYVQISDLLVPSVSSLDCQSPQDESPNSTIHLDHTETPGTNPINKPTIDALSEHLGADYVKALDGNEVSVGENGEESKLIAQGSIGDSDNNREAISPSSFCSGDSDTIEPLVTSFFGTDILLEQAKKNLGERCYLLLQEVIKTQWFLDRLKSLIYCESKIIFINTGRDPKTCQDTNEFLNCLSSIDPNVLTGAIAAVLSEIFREHNTGDKNVSGGAADNQEVASISGCGTSSCTTPNLPTDVNIASDFEEKLVDIPYANTPQGFNSSNSSMPELKLVGNCIPHTNDSVSDYNGATGSSLKLGLSDEVWEKAFDLITLEKRDEKMKKMAQILFIGIFSEEEILECTVRGKKDTKVFDTQKVRFLYRGVAWLLGKPQIRTQEAFNFYVSENDPRLTEQEEKNLKTSVFSEYAYNQREKIKKREKRRQN